jgi:hypothetical protein
MNQLWRLVFLLVVVGLFVACSDEATGPVDEGGPVTYGFSLYRYGTEFYGIWMFSATDWMGVGADGQIVHFKNGDVYPIDPGVVNHLNDIWASGPRDIFVVGDRYQSGPGLILHYDGSTWSQMTHSFQTDIKGVFGLSSTNVYAVTSDGLVIHYDGSSWTQAYDRPGGRGLADVWCESLTNVIAVGESGGIVRWDGGSWSDDSVLGDDFTGVWGAAYNQIYVCGGEQIWLYDGSWGVDQQSAGWELEEIHGSGANDVWAVGPNRNVVHWNGTSWTEVEAGDADGGNDFHAVWSWSSTNAVLLSDHGGVYQYDGADWNEINNSNQGGWQDMYGLSADAIYAVSGNRLIDWDGTAWSEENPNSGYNLSVWCSAVDAVWTCGWPGSGAPRYVYRYNGASWSQEYSIDWTMPWGVWGADADHIFVVWEEGIVSHYNGTSWSQQQVTTSPVNLRDVWGASATDVFAVGADGTVAHLQGTTWSEMTTGVSSGIELSAVWGTSATDVVAVGVAGTIIRFDGTSWNAEDSGTTVILTGVWGDAPDNYWVVGMSGTVLHYNGTNWSAVPSGLTDEFGLNAVWGSGGADVWVGGDSDHLMHWERR